MILEKLAGGRFIFNLGHGILPETPIAHVERLIAAGAGRQMSAEFWGNLYPWLKAFHIIAVIAWMAGLFYLPRLFVYHADAPVGSDKSETFKVMERRLLRAIMNPAMIATWLFGVAIATIGGWWSSPGCTPRSCSSSS